MHHCATNSRNEHAVPKQSIAVLNVKTIYRKEKLPYQYAIDFVWYRITCRLKSFHYLIQTDALQLAIDT
ncbi:hypothetical protein T01_504 [Trichinella spiralis]|uniref:Uncharacterized protein n=1 Tax=Trichinella spiralis TaxID=6334 RepID=A0A0V1BBA5_TRISP|nr:hypothetical protein T01_504 [Trichinella spiralis]